MRISRYDGFRKYTKPRVVERLNRILAAILYDIASNPEQEDTNGKHRTEQAD